MKEATENWITDQCKEIDSEIRTGNSKAAFDTLKSVTGAQQTKTKLIENTNSKLLAEEKAIHKRWTEYCMGLYNYKIKTDADIMNNKDKIENRNRRSANT